MSARKVVINGRQLSSPYAGGVVRYAQEVSKRMTGARVLVPPARMMSGPLGHLWDQTAAHARARSAVLFSPANFGPLRHPRHVVTIHDISPIEHPEWFSPHYARLFGQLVPRLARSCAGVITDSMFSKERLLAVVGLDDTKITVAGAGVSDAFARNVPTEGNGDVVVLGGHDPRKNVDGVLQAWELLEDLADHRLVVVGGDRSRWVFDSAPMAAGATTQQDLTDDELARLMHEASLVVFCPFYEGFGLPVLEAMAVGTPVVASNIPPLIELAEDVAWFADPSSPISIAAAMEGALQAGTERPARVTAGLRRAEQYSWDDVAHTVTGVLDGVE